MSVYLDDFGLFANSESKAREQVGVVTDTLQRLGWRISPKSCIEPSQEITFLGVRINSRNMTVALPEDKILTIRRLAAKIIRTYKFTNNLLYTKIQFTYLFRKQNIKFPSLTEPHGSHKLQHHRNRSSEVTCKASSRGYYPSSNLTTTVGIQGVPVRTSTIFPTVLALSAPGRLRASHSKKAASRTSVHGCLRLCVGRPMEEPVPQSFFHIARSLESTHKRKS